MTDLCKIFIFDVPIHAVETGIPRQCGSAYKNECRAASQGQCIRRQGFPWPVMAECVNIAVFSFTVLKYFYRPLFTKLYLMTGPVEW